MTTPESSNDDIFAPGELLGFIPVYGLSISGQHAVPPAPVETSADLLKLDGGRQVQASEPANDEHPWSHEKAKQIAYASIGRWKPRTTFNRRREWWDRLRAATTPEEKVTCERMINYISEAIGLHHHERGRALCESNTYADSLPTVPGKRDADDVDRWR